MIGHQNSNADHTLDLWSIAVVMTFGFIILWHLWQRFSKRQWSKSYP
jgi:hypothetical protein